VKRDNRREDRLNNLETRYEGHKPRDKRLGKEGRQGRKEKNPGMYINFFIVSILGSCDNKLLAYSASALRIVSELG
jgi:hypothetical protein